MRSKNVDCHGVNDHEEVVAGTKRASTGRQHNLSRTLPLLKGMQAHLHLSERVVGLRTPRVKCFSACGSGNGRRGRKRWEQQGKNGDVHDKTQKS
jgi:hypothetical protein